MHCEDCGFPIDELNASQPVCPRCGGLSTDTDLYPADIDCMVEDALAGRREQEREAHVLEFELDQFDAYPPEIDDAEWAEAMLRLAKSNPAYTEFELLGTAARTKGPAPVVNYLAPRSAGGKPMHLYAGQTRHIGTEGEQSGFEARVPATLLR